MRALISVYDKTGLVEFASTLRDLGVELVASGGTGLVLAEADLHAITVEELTGLPDLFDGRVKTLHPAIHAGILARDTDQDRSVLSEQGWPLFDLVIINLYPFAQTVSRPDVTLEEVVEQIDIGGVALIRAAAKNFQRVAVVVDPADYALIVRDLRTGDKVAPETRRMLAIKAFETTKQYDQQISHYLSGPITNDTYLPDTLSLNLSTAQVLRYGENPHQDAAYYAAPGIGPLGGDLLQGKPLSYNNLLDLNAAWAAASDFESPTVVIVKHLSPCGIASDSHLSKAFRQALASDPVSAFGGVIAANQPFDQAAAEALGDLFVEAIAAPDFTPEALTVLTNRTNCRLLKMNPIAAVGYQIRSVRGGVLVQSEDASDDQTWTVVTKRQPSKAELEALRFAWRSVKHVKSNAIVLSTHKTTVGIGGGLPSRVDAVRIAVEKAGSRAQGAVMASDAFFPFPDGLEIATQAGVIAVVQPGGSVKDGDVIAAADRHGIVMMFTGVRHFRH